MNRMNPMTRPWPTATRMIGVLSVVATLTGCGTDSPNNAASRAAGHVTITNCTRQITFPQPAERLYVVEEAIISMLLEIGAGDRIAAVASLGEDKDVLADVYGQDTVDSLA